MTVLASCENLLHEDPIDFISSENWSEAAAKSAEVINSSYLQWEDFSKIFWTSTSAEDIHSYHFSVNRNYWDKNDLRKEFNIYSSYLNAAGELVETDPQNRYRLRKFIKDPAGNATMHQFRKVIRIQVIDLTHPTAEMKSTTIEKMQYKNHEQST